MKYDYSVVLTDAEIVDKCDIFTGECEGSTPLEAVNGALSETTDWLENEFANLAPTVEISRDLRFSAWRAEADSHGLGIASVLLVPLGVLPDDWKV
jgi:hypothetical protein